jgi:hypothetical protein
MLCTECHNEVSENARYCGGCGKRLTTSAHCRKCHHPRNRGAFCENCGLRRVPEDEDDSFLEEIAKGILGNLKKRRIGFTHLLMGAPTRLLGVRKDSWAAEELAYLLGLPALAAASNPSKGGDGGNFG